MTLEPKPGGFVVRLRYGRNANGKPQRGRFLVATKDEKVAADCEIRMAAAAYSLAKLQHPKTQEFLTEMGRVAGDGKAFRALEHAVSKFALEAAHAPVAPAGPATFAQVVDEWCSGRLHQRDPERVKFQKPRSLKITRATLATFLPVLGVLPIAEITDEQLAKAKARIPQGLDPDSRRVYLSRLRSVFRLAVKPLRLISAVPQEIEDVPSPKKQGLFWFLYPDEERLLIGCTKIPLAYRVLYGWLSRNGGRITETSLLDYAHLDLERGRVNIEAAWTKTNRARFWNLDPDVHSAMRAWHLLDGERGPTARVFHAPMSQRIAGRTLIDRLHQDLTTAGIDRRELHTTTPGSRRLRSHDFRTGFCTMARRAGKPDSWIMDRSGHESVSQLERYSKLVRHADEQDLPKWWAPMDQAIPELRFALAHSEGPARALPRGPSRKQAVSSSSAYIITESATEETQAKTPSKPASVTPETSLPPTSGPASFKGVGQTGPSGPGQGEVLPEPADDTPERALVRIEEGLQRDLSVALEKGWLEIANKILGELSERRRARSAPSVPSLSDARRKREEKP